MNTMLDQYQNSPTMHYPVDRPCCIVALDLGLGQKIPTCLPNQVRLRKKSGLGPDSMSKILARV